MHKHNILVVFLVALSLTACEETEEYVPKPKGYNRIDLHKPEYQVLKEGHPFKFEHSIYSVIRRDSSSIAEPHWINVYYPQFDADIQLTYKPLFGKKDQKRLNELIDDSYKLANKHQVKAYSIEEYIVKTDSSGKANIIELSGDVPSPFQFYITDSSKHFMRGALYFKSTQIDSLSPAIEYLKEDVIHLVKSLKWQK